MAKSDIICTVTGIRPDFIRMSEVFKKLDTNFTHIMIHTGQHYDTMLSDVFFTELSLRKPDYNLCIGAEGRLHYDQQALLGSSIIECLQKNDIQPKIVLFLGDANTSLASVPLKKEGYHIGHIEAGMRSGDEWMPEEINRKACDHVSSLLFAYHSDYANNLLHENIPANKIFTVGNTIIEVFDKFLDRTYVAEKDYILIDIHRHENVTNPKRMEAILDFCRALGTMLGLPMNMLAMPRTRAIVENNNIEMGDIQFIPLMGYVDYLKAVQNAVVLVSDSGTAQEESPLLKTPVIVPRTSTERPHAVSNGSSILVDPEDHQSLLRTVTFVHAYTPSEIDNSWLGDGQTSERIIDILRTWCAGQRI